MSEEILQDLGEHILETHSKDVVSTNMVSGELVLEVKKEGMLKVLQFLRDDQECLFKVFIDVTATDYPARQKRFEVVYNLLSLRQNQRIRVKVHLEDGEAIPSVVPLFSAAGWFERETYDMYGIFFEGNPDLRRLLTDYGFEGHPLRKDFPMSGYVEMSYDPELQRVVYEPVSLVQDFRNFDFLSPWEGMENVHLPGDEKAVKPEFGEIDYKSSAAADVKE